VRVGGEGGERVVVGEVQADQVEATGEEGDGVIGGVVLPVGLGGECVGEGDGFGVGDQVACQEVWGRR
jgi:hypothetical protein